MPSLKQWILCSLSFFSVGTVIAQSTSSAVYQDANGCLRYVADAENNYIPDFSQAGYKNGDAPIPNVPVVKTIGPISGDNTAHIQAALDEVGKLPLDSQGIRGALLLKPGRYEVHGVITIRESGVVLRGSGMGENPDSNTILLGIGNVPAGRNVLQAGYSSNIGWTAPFPGIRTIVTSPFIQAGSRTLQVARTDLFKPGDQVIIFQASTQKWLESIDFGATDIDTPWKPGEIDLYFNRYVTAVYPDQGKIQLDVPVYDHLEPALAAVEVFIPFNPGVKRNIGIEQLRIDIQTAGPTDENHAKSAIKLQGVEDCWVSQITALHFTYAGVDMELTTRVTVKSSFALEPHSIIDGERRYNFAVASRTNNVLFQDCHATQGRHSFVSNGASSVSGIVFTQGTSATDYNSSEGHRRWSQGLLYDNITFTNTQTTIPLALYNRGSHGTGHGWSSVHSVAWNVKAPPTKRIVIQKPPSRQNYGIGCSPEVSREYIFRHPAGYIDLTNQAPLPKSLYQAQLEARRQFGIMPDAPARLKATRQEGSQQILLEWLDIAADEAGYRVERSDDNGITFVPVAELSANTTTFTVNQNTSGNPVFRVHAFNNRCTSATSNPATVQVITNLELLSPESWSVYPNPVEEIVHIQSSNRINKIQVYNTLGHIVAHSFTQNTINQVSLKGAAPGMYFLQVEDVSGSRGVTRIIKK